MFAHRDLSVGCGWHGKWYGWSRSTQHAGPPRQEGQDKMSTKYEIGIEPDSNGGVKAEVFADGTLIHRTVRFESEQNALHRAELFLLDVKNVPPGKWTVKGFRNDLHRMMCQPKSWFKS